MSQPVLPPPPSVENGLGKDQGESDEGLPKRFGKYTLLRSLARGGMAELFLAIQKSLSGFEKLIVIKRILPSMNQDSAFINMLLHEARIAATLSHPNIVQIFDVGQVDGLYFIAMEHVHGEDIRSIVRQMRKKGVSEFPLEHALAITLGMCSGLAYAHDKRDLDNTPLGIVHRDISPQNVVVTFSGDVKIVDFGIAKSDTKMNTETKSGKLKGKIPYMSPEQARGEPIDARSDIFAAGVMLFELTTGKRLFKGASEYETLKLICERDYPRPSQIRPGYPAALERVVMKALSKDKADRYQSAREMQADLEAFVREERTHVSTINLTQFMQMLFEDKLESQKEALLQGKQLADIIDLQQARESMAELPLTTHAALSTPAASHTLPGVDAKKRSSGPWVALTLGALLIGVSAFGTIYWMKSKQSSVTATHADAPAAPIVRGTIDVTSDPPGAAIWIDGDLRPEVTPATIAQLPTTGQALEIKITKDGFEANKQLVTLTETAPSANVRASMKRGSVTLDVTIAPASAKPIVSVDGKKYDGLAIDGVSSGDQHKLTVSAPGYYEFATTFLGSPQEKKHFDVTLQKMGTGSLTMKPSGAPANAVGGVGKLNVGASGGWCNVAVDGAAKGPTPLAGIELPAGPHKITCTPNDGKPAQSASVVIGADSTARYKFTL